MDGAISLKGFVGAQAAVTVDGIVTPSVSADGYLQFDAGLNSNPCWTLTAGLEASVGVSASILGQNIGSLNSGLTNFFSTPLAQSASSNCFAPTLNSVTPCWATTGSSDTSVALVGNNFPPDAIVSWQGMNLPTTFTDPSDLATILPAASLANDGTWQVTVTSPDIPGGSSSLPFTVASTDPGTSCNTLSIIGTWAGTGTYTDAGTGQAGDSGPVSATFTQTAGTLTGTIVFTDMDGIPEIVTPVSYTHLSSSSSSAVEAMAMLGVTALS